MSRIEKTLHQLGYENAEAFKASMVTKLHSVELEGSEKQVAWVRDIQKKMVTLAFDFYRCDPTALVYRVVKACEQKEAKWWIDRKDKKLPDLYEKEYRAFCDDLYKQYGMEAEDKEVELVKDMI